MGYAKSQVIKLLVFISWKKCWCFSIFLCSL